MTRSSVLNLTRRDFLKAAGLGLTLPHVARVSAATPETLYNGITLASPWPPSTHYFSDVLDLPPYLADPPAVIPIDLGRQLFVDDFLIQESTLNRTFHAAEYYPHNPVLTPETPWELKDEYAERTKTRPNPSAMVFSDGVFFDPKDKLFKLWYMGGYDQTVCLALSHDGLHWERPALDVVPGTNITASMLRDSTTVWLDLDEPNPQARYKLALFNGSDNALRLFTSPDGIHWKWIARSGQCGDRTTVFFNPFRKVWVFGLRGVIDGRSRHRRYYETRDFTRAYWNGDVETLWISADSLDHPRPDSNVPAELYNLDCVAYESLILGLFTIWRGEQQDREKPNDLCVGFSRDGFHWSRPSREPFIPVSEHVGDWNWANVQSAGGCCTIVGDELYFYVSGRQGVPGTNAPGRCSTGLAKLRRDGFASLNDDRDPKRPMQAFPGSTRTITTRPVRFNGRYLFVNANVDVSGGDLRVEVLDREGRVLQPFTSEACVPVSGNGTRMRVAWRGRPTLEELAGEVVRFRFSLKSGKLYAFWVSATADGRSRGYVAAGGPGFAHTSDI